MSYCHYAPLLQSHRSWKSYSFIKNCLDFRVSAKDNKLAMLLMTTSEKADFKIKYIHTPTDKYARTHLFPNQSLIYKAGNSKIHLQQKLLRNRKVLTRLFLCWEPELDDRLMITSNHVTALKRDICMLFLNMCLDTILPKSANDHTLALQYTSSISSHRHFQDSC